MTTNSCFYINISLHVVGSVSKYLNAKKLNFETFDMCTSQILCELCMMLCTPFVFVDSLFPIPSCNSEFTPFSKLSVYVMLRCAQHANQKHQLK